MEVTTIVLNFNGEDLLPDALASLNGQTCASLETIVADNGSTDSSAKVAEEYGAKFIALNENLGFARANNTAAQEAAGKYLFFANNDMRFDRECVESLAQTLDEHEQAFAADCTQYKWGTREIIHAGTQLRPGSWRSSPLPFLEVDPVGARGALTPVPWTCAGNTMVRKEMFVKLGGFDSQFFMNGEDVDLCLRAWMRGWPCIYVPDTKWRNGIEHKVGATVKRTRDWRIARSSGNYLRFGLKTMKSHTFVEFLGAYGLGSLNSLLAGNRRRILGFFLGLTWWASISGQTLRERRKTLRDSMIPIEEILAFFVQCQSPLTMDYALEWLEPKKNHSFERTQAPGWQ